ncbi:hypothetical protein ACM39_10635 [Chryseobacterium sp. FH2]|uniref:4'-phosphopantetheinyl transferase family protein n=1 Tax=Chryseobacterium sp. FH2 TaxID=1674291 RepID=UPI00065AEC7B|nr:4'-phosphopantetheinyl transferase superfamily protein [Chryseobacterium sp. FH2]KMQ67796.1 hypothetical protein ACM39_10635 [Chryseobacterium sp. FH2]
MEVWAVYSFLDKNDPERIEGLFSLLPENMVQSVNKYKNINDRKARVIAKLLLEILVRKMFPDQNFFWNLYSKDSFSKPYFKGLEINFNTSHNENLCIVCAVQKDKCGIDSETVKPLDWKIYNDFLHPDEKRFINRQTNQQAAFYEIWTKKEAVLKASGLGIARELESIDAHKKMVTVNHQNYVTQKLDISENSITYIATEREINKLNLEEIIF